MGTLNRIDIPSIQDFPGAKFSIKGDVPAAQCSEAKLEVTDGYTVDFPVYQIATNTFDYLLGYDLTGKVCTVTSSVGGNTGDFDIVSNNPEVMIVVQDPGDGDPVEWYVHDGGSLILTRNAHSFAAFIKAAGYAYTFKGGKLYTNMPSGQLQNACTILWNPGK